MKALEASFSELPFQKLDDIKQINSKKDLFPSDLPQNPNQILYDGSFPLPIQNRKGFYIYTSTPRALLDNKKPFRIGRNSQYK